MDNKYTVVGTVVTFAIIGIIAAAWGWTQLPQHQASADTTTAMIPYLEQQKAIQTDALYADTQLRLERAAKIQPYKTAAGVAVFLLAIMAMAAVGSYTAVYSYHQGRRVAKQMSLPVAQAVGEHHMLLGDGQAAILWNLVTGRSDAALTAVSGDEDMAALMTKVMVTRELAAGAEAVARHTKDAAVGNYLMGQVENITHETIRRDDA
jgi:hypothetical protein